MKIYKYEFVNEQSQLLGWPDDNQLQSNLLS